MARGRSGRNGTAAPEYAMVRFHIPLIGVLALAAGGCAPDPDPSTIAVPGATLAPLRLVTCAGRTLAPATATRCPQEPR